MGLPLNVLVIESAMVCHHMNWRLGNSADSSLLVLPARHAFDAVAQCLDTPLGILQNSVSEAHMLCQTRHNELPKGNCQMR